MGGRCVGRIKAWETINLSAREIKAAGSIQAGCTTQEMANNLTPHSDRNCRGFLLQKRACHKTAINTRIMYSHAPRCKCPIALLRVRLRVSRLAVCREAGCTTAPMPCPSRPPYTPSCHFRLPPHHPPPPAHLLALASPSPSPPQ